MAQRCQLTPGVGGSVHDASESSTEVRPLAAGTHVVDLAFVPEPLLSTRLSFSIDAHKAVAPAPAPLLPPPVAGRPELEPEPGGTAPPSDPVLVQALAERLRRLDAIEPTQWIPWCGR